MLPPGLHSQQAGTMIPTLMPIPPTLPPVNRFAVPEKHRSHV
jgi:hypothetical protein